jgi:hypothetical protein
MSLWRTRFGTLGILAVTDALKKKKPLRAVYGNIDDAKAYGVSLHNRFMCEGVEVWITHIGGYPGKYNPAIKRRWLFTQIIYLWTFTFLKVMFDKKYDLLYEPALAEKVVSSVRTMLRFVIEGDKIKDLEIIEIEKGVTKLCAKWDFKVY